MALKPLGVVGDALKEHVLSGKTFSSEEEDVGVVGTMPNRGSQNFTPGTSNQSIPAGYHNGNGTVYGDSNLQPENIKDGVSIFGVSGNMPSFHRSTLYFEAQYEGDWKKRWQSSQNSSFSFNSNHIYMYGGAATNTSNYPNPPVGSCAGTKSPIDLTYVDRLICDFAHESPTDYDSGVGFGISTQSSGFRSTFEDEFRRSSTNSRGEYELDVSNYTGNYYITAYGANTHSSSSRSSVMRMYGMRLLYEIPPQ